MSDSVEERLLYFSRHGNVTEVQKVLDENPSLNINYKGEIELSYTEVL